MQKAWRRDTLMFDGADVQLLPDFSHHTIQARRKLKPLLAVITGTATTYSRCVRFLSGLLSPPWAPKLRRQTTRCSPGDTGPQGSFIKFSPLCLKHAGDVRKRTDCFFTFSGCTLYSDPFSPKLGKLPNALHIDTSHMTRPSSSSTTPRPHTRLSINLRSVTSLTQQIMHPSFFWKKSNPPSMAHWIHKVKDIRFMEGLIRSPHNTRVGLSDLWHFWLEFLCSDEGRSPTVPSPQQLLSNQLASSPEFFACSPCVSSFSSFSTTILHLCSMEPPVSRIF